MSAIANADYGIIHAPSFDQSCGHLKGKDEPICDRDIRHACLFALCDVGALCIVHRCLEGVFDVVGGQVHVGGNLYGVGNSFSVDHDGEGNVHS
ncbi:MAG TPA: hypothetical protein VFW94_23510 [Candidatus Acidoferrales bacterium]|nr:hypothetical protein [Candidatus Acidoferrales bacterium]